MLGTYSDEFGKLDFERSQHGSGMSNRSQARRFVSALNSLAERTYNNLFDLQQLRQIAKELQIRVSLEIEQFLTNCKTSQNYLLQNGKVTRFTWCASLLKEREISSVCCFEDESPLCQLSWWQSHLPVTLLASEAGPYKMLLHFVKSGFGFSVLYFLWLLGMHLWCFLNGDCCGVHVLLQHCSDSSARPLYTF